MSADTPRGAWRAGRDAASRASEDETLTGAALRTTVDVAEPEQLRALEGDRDEPEPVPCPVADCDGTWRPTLADDTDADLACDESTCQQTATLRETDE